MPLIVAMGAAIVIALLAPLALLFGGSWFVFRADPSAGGNPRRNKPRAQKQRARIAGID